MIQINIMITLLAVAALAKGAMECNLTRPTDAQQCFGALGKPLMFHLPTNRSIKTKLKKNDAVIFHSYNNISIIGNEKYRNTSTLLKDGTFKIDMTTRTDSGDYELEIHTSTSGTLLKVVKISLEIIEPVSEPAVNQTCLSPEQMKVSCSAEGDGVQFTLSLDNQILEQTRVEGTETLNGSNVSIILHAQLGKLVCKVQNKVSNKQTFIQLTSCSASSPLSLLIVAVTASVVSLLLLLAVFLGIKIFKARRRTMKKGDAEEEVVYSDVRGSAASALFRGNAEEEEVVYSDVRGSAAARQLHGC